MTGKPFVSAAVVLAVVFLTIAIAGGIAAAEPPQRISPTTEPLVTLPFGLKWTHNPFEAIAVLKEIEGVTEIWVGNQDVFEMNEAEVRSHLTSTLHVRRYDDWGGAFADSVLGMVVRPIMIQRVSCELSLRFEVHRALNLIDPDRVVRVQIDHNSTPSDILWPVYLVEAKIRSSNSERLPGEAVEALRNSIFHRYRPIIQAAWTRSLADQHAAFDDPQLRAVNARVIQSRAYQAYSAAHLDYLLATTPGERDNLLKKRDIPFQALRDSILAMNWEFGRWTEGISRMANVSANWRPDGTLGNFGLGFDDGVVSFKATAVTGGSLAVEYARTKKYREMLDTATKDFETRAKQQAESRLRESRSDSPDFSDEL